MADEHDDPPADPWAAPPEGAQAGQPGAPGRRPLPPPPAPPPPALAPWQQRNEGPSERPPTPQPGGSRPGRRPGPGRGSASARVGIVLGLVGLLVVNDAGYGLAFGLGAAVLGGFALRDARAGRSSMTSALGAFLVGVAVVSMSLSLLALSRTKDISELQRCLDRAQTHEAAAACEQAHGGSSQGTGG